MQQTMQCIHPTCRHVHESVEEKFHSLHVPVRTEGGELLHSVQAALDAHMPSSLVGYDMICGGCGGIGPQWHKVDNSTSLPRVLLVTLVRWANHFDEAALLHPVEATEHIDFRGGRFSLCAVVVHLGASPKSGHYITVARHRTRDAVWWLYDDERRIIATPEEVATTCEYRSHGQMQSYVLLYETMD